MKNIYELMKCQKALFWLILLHLISGAVSSFVSKLILSEWPKIVS